jgi:hypothetical protein
VEQLGFDMGVSVTPQGLYDDLKEEGLIGDEYVIPRSPPHKGLRILLGLGKWLSKYEKDGFFSFFINGFIFYYIYWIRPF